MLRNERMHRCGVVEPETDCFGPRPREARVRMRGLGCCTGSRWIAELIRQQFIECFAGGFRGDAEHGRAEGEQKALHQR